MNKYAILQFFRNQSFLIRIFIWFRLSCFPFEELIDYLPTKGNMLDVGTGHGILPLLLASKYMKYKITGYDPDKERIQIAKKVGSVFRDISYGNSMENKSLRNNYDFITLIDVFYLVPSHEKLFLLKRIYSLLNNQGHLYIVIVDKNNSIGYFLTYLQEILMVKILKITQSQRSKLYFDTVKEVVNHLRKESFNIQKSVRLKPPFPYFHPHWLIIAVK